MMGNAKFPCKALNYPELLSQFNTISPKGSTQDCNIRDVGGRLGIFAELCGSIGTAVWLQKHKKSVMLYMCSAKQGTTLIITL